LEDILYFLLSMNKVGFLFNDRMVKLCTFLFLFFSL